MDFDEEFEKDLEKFVKVSQTFNDVICAKYHINYLKYSITN